MATIKKPSASRFSNIRTYDELEASLRMVQREKAGNQLSRQVSFFSNGISSGIKWTDLALVVIRLLKRRLLK